MEARLSGDNEYGRPSRMKISAAGRMPTIDFAHFAVHDDSFVFATDVTSASTADRSYHIKPIAGGALHSILGFTATAGASLELMEIPSSDVTVAGTAITHTRANRGSAVGSTGRLTTYHTPTYSTGDAVVIMRAHNGGTATAQGNTLNIGGGARPGEELIFPSTAGKSWVLKVTREAASKISFIHEYYDVR